MTDRASIQQDVVVDDSKRIEAQLAEYLAGQPASRQALHKWMSWLTIASVAVPVGLFFRALYLSIIWKRIDPIRIPIAWLIFVVSGTLPFILTGLHAVLLRAFPPIGVAMRGQKFVTGSSAVWMGAGLAVVMLLVAAFWAYFGYVVWTVNMAMLEVMVNIVANVFGVGAVIAVLYSLYQKFRRKL
jgi:hypothetical protein